MPPWIEQLQSVNWREASCIFFGAYVVGCFATGYYVVRAWIGKDVRELGSGNVGAKNVGRLLGWPGFVITLLGDSAKGALAIWAARHFINDDAVTGAAMLGVVSGHIWPAQLRFRGGKGVATSLGALIIYDYHLAGMFLVLWLISLAVLRKWVLGGLVAFAALPVTTKFLEPDQAKVVITSVLAGIVLIAHHRNLRDEIHHLIELLRGERASEKIRTKPNPPKL